MVKEKKESLEQVRKEINEIDLKIVRDLAERFKLVERVLSKKEEGHLMLRDKEREKTLLGKIVRAGRPLGLDTYFLTRVF